MSNPLDACASSYSLNSKTTVAALHFPLVGCGTDKPHDNSAKPHHMPEGFDLAPIAIGAYQPRWFRNEQHVNLVEVVQIHQDLNARRSVGSHSRTFSLTDDLLHRPPIDLSLAAGERSQAADAITVMAIGETPVPPAQATP